MGTELARVLDPEGHEWSFGTSSPGAVGEAPSGGPLGPEATTRSRGDHVGNLCVTLRHKLALHAPHRCPEHELVALSLAGAKR